MCYFFFASAHVGDHIFKELVCGFLCDRTRILVSHQLSLVLPASSLVMCLDGGGVAACCSPSSLPVTLQAYIEDLRKRDHDHPHEMQSLSSQRQGGGVHAANKKKRERGWTEKRCAFLDMVISAAVDTREVQFSPNPLTPSSFEIPVAQVIHLPAKSIKSSGKHAATIENDNTGKIDNNTDVNDDDEDVGDVGDDGEEGEVSSKSIPEVTLLVEKEEKCVGSVGIDVYWFYLKSCGGWCAVVLIIVADMMIPVSWFLQNYSMGEWLHGLEAELTETTLNSRLGLYLLCVGFAVFCSIFRSLYQVKARMFASSNIHKWMLERVIAATVAWHDSQPTGRKINRFSQDISTVDGDLMDQLQAFLDCMLEALQVILVIVVLIPFMIPCLIPVLLFDWFVVNKYIKSSRELNRLESVNKSPVFVLFSETLSGMAVVRAFRHEERFFALCCQYVDMMNRCVNND